MSLTPAIGLLVKEPIIDVLHRSETRGASIRPSMVNRRISAEGPTWTTLHLTKKGITKYIVYVKSGFWSNHLLPQSTLDVALARKGSTLVAQIAESSVETGYLRRYTNLPVLLGILLNKRLTLLDPQSWDDKNDSHFIALYKTRLQLKTVLALCFTEADETYHHWKVFAGNSDGVCIQFDKNKLLKQLSQADGIKSSTVIYKTIAELRKLKLKTDDLPFLKRYPFQDEREFRFIYASESQVMASKDVPIALSCVTKIVFNPWMPTSVYKSVKGVICGIDGCKSLRLVRTSLVDNEKWKTIGQQMDKRTRHR